MSGPVERVDAAPEHREGSTPAPPTVEVLEPREATVGPLPSAGCCSAA